MKKTDLNLTNKTNSLIREVSHSNAEEASSWHWGQTEEGVTRAWIGMLRGEVHRAVQEEAKEFPRKGAELIPGRREHRRLYPISQIFVPATIITENYRT